MTDDEHQSEPSPDDVLESLREWCLAKRDEDTAQLLNDATPTLTVYESDWGIDMMTLHLEVPLGTYARIPDVEPFQEKLASMARELSKGYDSIEIRHVSINPRLLKAKPRHPVPTVKTSDVRRIWTPRRLRLFLSHVSQYKAEVGTLKYELEARGLSAFVAHQDIQPTLEWQNEIELALRSMDAMCALLTPDFHTSYWTDQEVGVALGRGVFVLAVQAPTTPYGFLGKAQALSGDLARPAPLAERIVAILAARGETRDAAVEGMIAALEQADTFEHAKAVSRLMEAQDVSLTGEQRSRVQSAITENRQVADAFGVPERLERLLNR